MDRAEKRGIQGHGVPRNCQNLHLGEKGRIHGDGLARICANLHLAETGGSKARASRRFARGKAVALKWNALECPLSKESLAMEVWQGMVQGMACSAFLCIVLKGTADCIVL
jgi:hypothetical protein